MSMQSDNINELMTALAKAQGKMSHASKDSENPHFRSRYADLASVWQACREPLASNGLAVTQTLDFLGDRQVLVTTLGHSSGQWIKSVMVLPQTGKPQEQGSLLSYYRRYSLASIAGVYQADDDAEAAQAPHRSQAISDEQCAILDSILQDLPGSDKGICEKFGLKSVYDLPASQFDFVVNTLRKRQKAKVQ